MRGAWFKISADKCQEDAGRYVADKFTTNKFAAHLSRKPDQAFYLQLTERKIFSFNSGYNKRLLSECNGNR
jgi:hypothetical protein